MRVCKNPECDTVLTTRKSYCQRGCQKRAANIRAKEKRIREKERQIVEDQIALSRFWPKAADHILAAVAVNLPKKRARPAAYRLWKAGKDQREQSS